MIRVNIHAWGGQQGIASRVTQYPEPAPEPPIPGPFPPDSGPEPEPPEPEPPIA